MYIPLADYPDVTHFPDSLKTKGEKGENYVLQVITPLPLDQWTSDTLDDAVRKPFTIL